jgi:hypothetical protein
MLCLARTVSLLLLGRILQGGRAAIVWTVGLALLVDTVGQRDIGKTLGYTSISMSLSILSAPLLGGVVYEKAGYYAVYYMAFGILALDIILRLLLIEKKIARQWLPEDIVESNEISTPRRRSNPEKTVEDKSKEVVPEDGSTLEPISGLPLARPPSKYPPVLTLLKSRRLLAALWGCVVQMSQMTAFDGVVPIFVKETFHWVSLISIASLIPLSFLEFITFDYIGSW